MRPLVLLSAFLLACPVDPGDPAEPPVEYPDTLAWPVDEAGPYEVGYLKLETSYTLPSTGEVRTIPVHLWFPTEDTEGDEVRHEGIFMDPSLGGATPMNPVHEGGYPVLVYSHGDQGYGGASNFLMHHVARHGWLAVAPDHMGNTLSTSVQPRPVHMHVDRSHDIRAALDFVEAGIDELAGPAQVDGAVMAGHSYGGHTTWATAGGDFDVAAIEQRCTDDPDQYGAGSCNQMAFDAFEAGGRDDRLVAAIPLDGAGNTDWFGDTGLGAISIPMFQFYTDGDLARRTPAARAPGVELSTVQIAGACHQTFALGSPCSTLGGEEGFAIVEAYAFAFARRQVLGDDSALTTAILDGSHEVSDRVTYEPVGR